MRQIKNRRYIIWMCFLFILQIVPNFSQAGEVVKFQKRILSIDAEKTPLGKILEEIYQKAGVDIIGLESRKDEQITFFSSGEVEEILRRLLRHLKEDNYAFEFSDVRLLKISVVPDSRNRRIASSPVQRNSRIEEQKELVSAIKVQGIVDGTQAAYLGLMKGDYLLEYNGKRLRHSQQLVREVKRNADQENIEMTVIRDGTPMQFMLKGGLIGVNITTSRVPKEELGE